MFFQSKGIPHSDPRYQQYVPLLFFHYHIPIFHCRYAARIQSNLTWLASAADFNARQGVCTIPFHRPFHSFQSNPILHRTPPSPSPSSILHPP